MKVTPPLFFLFIFIFLRIVVHCDMEVFIWRVESLTVQHILLGPAALKATKTRRFICHQIHITGYFFGIMLLFSADSRNLGKFHRTHFSSLKVNIQDFLQVFKGSGIGKMEDNLRNSE